MDSQKKDRSDARCVEDWPRLDRSEAWNGWAARDVPKPPGSPDLACVQSPMGTLAYPWFGLGGRGRRSSHGDGRRSRDKLQPSGFAMERTVRNVAACRSQRVRTAERTGS